MATLNAPENGKAVKGRMKKPVPRVDLTAMVDLMFLLTTFFMLTTSLGQLNAADIAKPIPGVEKTGYPSSRTMTILLGKNNQTVYYMGEAEKANMQTVPLESIQKEILSNKLSVAKLYRHNPGKEMIVIIKPTKSSTYKNFVDAIDEMKIASIKTYAIDDAYIASKEESYMQLKGI